MHHLSSAGPAWHGLKTTTKAEDGGDRIAEQRVDLRHSRCLDCSSSGSICSPQKKIANSGPRP
jgi:hypothetical protein